MPRHVGGVMGVRSPSRNVELERPPTFAGMGLDPGMRAQRGEFTDVASPGYARQAAAHAERGGAMEFASREEQGERDVFRDQVLAVVIPVLLGLIGGGAATGGMNSMVRAGNAGRGPIGAMRGFQPLAGGRVAPNLPPRNAMTSGSNLPHPRTFVAGSQGTSARNATLDATDDLMNRFMQARHARQYPGLGMGGRPT